jgi:hypothetical protein
MYVYGFCFSYLQMQPVIFPIDLRNVPENMADVMKEIKKVIIDS